MSSYWKLFLVKLAFINYFIIIFNPLPFMILITLLMVLIRKKSQFIKYYVEILYSTAFLVSDYMALYFNSD